MENSIEPILDETIDFFKDEYKDLHSELVDWKDLLIQFEVEKLKSNKDPERLASLRTTEEFIWNNIQTEKARKEKLVLDKSWDLAERILGAVKKIVLA